MDQFLDDLAVWLSATWRSVSDAAASVGADISADEAVIAYAVVAAFLAALLVAVAVAARRAARRADAAALRVEAAAARVEALTRTLMTPDPGRSDSDAVPDSSRPVTPPPAPTSAAAASAGDGAVADRVDALGRSLETHHDRLVAEIETIKASVSDLRAEVVDHQTAKYRVNEAIRQAMAPRRGSNI
jgi:type II secretory pathway pseudopilin PulG